MTEWYDDMKCILMQAGADNKVKPTVCEYEYYNVYVRVFVCECERERVIFIFFGIMCKRSVSMSVIR